MSAKEKKKRKGFKFLTVLLILVVLIAGALLAIKVLEDRENIDVSTKDTDTLNEKQEEVIKTPKTLSGTSRPIAVMIDNNINAMPQAGLEEADIVYEIIVEGGESRLMLIMQDKDIERVGPLRSSRHYFLDYALENDAIYVHYGWSPYAKEDISELGVNNINGIYESETAFWRDSNRYAPHNAVTSTDDILKIAERNEYRLETKKDPVLNYVVEEVNLEDGKAADTVTIPYSYYNTVEYEYDEDTKTYIRYSRGEKQTDWNTEKTIKTKNIIITFAENWSLDSYGRQEVDNIGTLDGYYITNGKAIKIKCEKKSRKAQTVYKDLEGNEIDVNDGKTFIQICPLNSNVVIEGEETEDAIENTVNEIDN